MAAYAALASLMNMNNIEQLMNHPHLSASLDGEQFQPLLETAGLLLDFIEGYNHGGVASKEVEDLEKKIASAAHAAEDVIESRIVDQIHAGSTRVSLNCSLHLQQIVQDMDEILREANELKEELGFREEQPTHWRRPPMEMETVMVGFEDEQMRIMDELTNQQSSRRVISIVGMGGTGKSTLARNVYQKLCIRHHFDTRAWITVSQQYNVGEIIEEIISQLDSALGKSSDRTVHGLEEQLHETESSSHRTVHELGLQLCQTLFGRRYLIVLDDVWSVEAWDALRLYFREDRNGSRIVITTRLSSLVGDDLSTSSVEMRPLDEDKSWELFCNKVFRQEKCPDPELERLGREISRSCRGLPLSTVVIGGLLLNSPRSVPFWENVVSNIKSVPGSQEKKESLDILSLSYNYLPPYLKPCFLYMGTFKEDSEIRISNIIKLWIAEGFLRPRGALTLEEVAERYLKELIDRNLISVSKRRKNGKIGSCGIHDLMRDLCLEVGQQQGFFHVHTKGKLRGSMERRLIILKGNRSELLSGPALGRTIFAWGASTQTGAAASSKLLRVWSTIEAFLVSPEKLCLNVNMRYLAFFFSFKDMWKLPTSIFNVWNLQTLIVKQYHLHSIVVAPSEIWKMPQLKHTRCTEIYLPSDGLLMMDKLQTVRTAVNFRLSDEVCRMIPNIRKLRLLYQGNLHGYDDGLIEFMQNLKCLHKLESLSLSFKGIRKVSELNKKLAFPTSLNKLSLSGCRLGWEDLSMIGSLPQLEVLELGDSSVTVGNRWSPVDEQFLRLKFLKIDWCCDLIFWEADNSHFPVLEKLILSGLRQLEEIPWGIGDIPTLELIRIEYCSESAAISALKIKDDYLENRGDDGFQIQVRISASVLESFKEKVEAEGLTINHIQLEIR